MKRNTFFSLIIAILIALILFTGAFAIPILCRPFYYAHINGLNIEDSTGLTRDEITTAYNEMLDYCLGGSEFSTGVLPWTETGKSHFDDVRFLFLLDIRVLVVSAAVLAVLLVLCRARHYRPVRLRNRGPGFWSGVGLGCVFAVSGIIAAIDFNRFFVLFHALFFPGKDNWLLDDDMDAIITILPQEFFLHCAILVFAVIAAGCVFLIVSDLLLNRGPDSGHPVLHILHKRSD